MESDAVNSGGQSGGVQNSGSQIPLTKDQSGQNLSPQNLNPQNLNPQNLRPQEPKTINLDTSNPDIMNPRPMSAVGSQNTQSVQSSRQPSRGRFYFYCIIVAAFIAMLVWRFQLHTIMREQDKAPVIGVAKASKQDMPVYLSSFGTVTSKSTVNIVSQVSGKISKIYFQDGQKVSKNQVLLEIDPSLYRAALSQNEGQLERDAALLRNAKLDLQRYNDLWQTKSISQQILDSQAALVEQYLGTVKLDAALVKAAETNLSYCTITAPMDGVIGISQVDEGNIVAPLTTNIAIINSVSPINVIFSIPAKDFDPSFASKEIVVEAYKQDGVIAKGRLVAIDNQIDSTKGTVKLKAEFANEDGALFPNQFVDIKMLVNLQRDVVTVQKAAVQKGRNGDYVYKIQDGKARLVNVEVGESYHENVAIKSEIKEGDEVAIDGVDKLLDGMVVKTGHTK